MPNHDRPQIGSDSDRLRQEAYEQEAEALREDLVRYFAGGAALDELGLPLRQAIQEALRQVVREAFQDRDIKDMIRQQVRDTILDGLKSQLVTAQDQIIKEIGRELEGKWGRTLRNAMIQGIKETKQTEGKGSKARRRQDESAAPDQHPDFFMPAELPDDSGFSPGSTPYPSNPGYLTRFKKLAPWLLVPIALMVGMLFWMQFKPEKSDALARRSVEQDGTFATAETTRESLAREDPQHNEGVDREDLRNAWITRIEAAGRGLPADSPIRTNMDDYPAAAQFDCWFDKPAVTELDALLARSSVEGRELQDILRGDTFGPCVQERFAVPQNPLPIFGAQSVVHVLLQQHDRNRWKGCLEKKKPAGIPDLAAFETDGQRGPGTYKLLNGYLACAGWSSKLEIGQDSPASHYLFTSYVALRELSRKDE